MDQNTFRFWMPISSFDKGVDKSTGKQKMILGGIASTFDKDMDGENLDPSGFDTNYFKKYGLINWNHQGRNDPSMIVGEPTKVETKKEGLYVECELYESNPMAQKIYDLANTLKVDSTNRKLGYSVEGQVLERDSKNPKIVKKAVITGLAITHQPKNTKTYLDVLKGMQSDEQCDECDEVYITKAKRCPADGDVYPEDGEYLDNDGSIRFHKAGEICKYSEIKKEMNTENSEAVIPNTIGHRKEVDKKRKELNKAGVYNYIFKKFNNISSEDAIKLVNFCTNLFKSSNVNMNPTEEEIQKALDAVGLSDNELERIQNNRLSKGMGKNADTDNDSDTEEDYDDDGDDVRDDNDDDDTDNGKSMKSKKSRGKKSDDMTKSVVASSIFDTNLRLRDIEKSFDASMEFAKDTNKAVGRIMKSMFEMLMDLQERLDQADEKMEKALSTPNPQKSVTKAKAVERFSKGVGEVITLSKSQDKKKILNLLDVFTFQNSSYNEEIGKSMTMFENTNQLEKSVVDFLNTQNIQIID
ncbi:MAG: hypothetical protein SFU98_15820 [Leptospiraceae bacterium]|nr:hypothetical protein [Leptospiraceae bacterium]